MLLRELDQGLHGAGHPVLHDGVQLGGSGPAAAGDRGTDPVPVEGGAPGDDRDAAEGVQVGEGDGGDCHYACG